MADPRALGDKPVRDLPALLAFVNQLWLPDYRLLRRKFAGMLNRPGQFALPFWDSQAWHSIQLGTVADLSDADGLLDPLLGTVWVAREGVLTANRTYAPVAGGNYDSLTVWNLTSERTVTLTLGAGDMTLPPLYMGRIHGDPAAFVGLYREPIAIDPALF